MAALLMSTLCLGACASDTPSASGDSSTGTDGQEQQTLVVWSRGTADAMEGKCFLSDVEAFQKEHENVTVEHLYTFHGRSGRQMEHRFCQRHRP